MAFDRRIDPQIFLMFVNDFRNVVFQTYGREYLDSVYSHLVAGCHSLPTDLSPVTRSIRAGLLSRRPKARYPSVTTEILITLYTLLPVWLSDCLAQSLSMIPRQIKPQILTGGSPK